MIQKHWYHATTREAWKKIKEDGVLWGVSWGGVRQTFLAREKEDILGRVAWLSSPFGMTRAGVIHRSHLLLRVKYIPDGRNDDYDPKSWELVVKIPILKENVRVAGYLKT